MSTNFPFNSQTFDFDIKNAYSLAQVSQLAYVHFEEDEETRKSFISQANEWGFKQVYFFNFNSVYEDSQGMILADADKIIVGFRGTETSKIQDILTDLKLTQVKRLDGRVHKGFYSSFEDLWVSQIKIWNNEEEINQKTGIKYVLKDLLAEKKRPIFITGHSLGGAMAVLCAAACGIELRDLQLDLSLYTYGQPQVGDGDFTKTLSMNLKGMFRVVNNNDIVARIPIDITKMSQAIDYTHTGEFIYLDTEEKVHLKKLKWWELKKDELLGRLEDIGKPGTDGVKDHDLGKYVSILKGALDNPSNIIN